jgi:hypothetical protein
MTLYIFVLSYLVYSQVGLELVLDEQHFDHIIPPQKKEKQ